ncbi:hypothetical protein [Pseudalkalibacillus sp. SCS-8]|uniref:hypothetical protein n=1 Tax=Pseudalkalibacillus nanhaiensis TaxID=3115291 RepID=UPI0032D9C35E
MMLKRKHLVISVLILLLFVTFFLNPTTEEYLQYSEETTGIQTPSDIEIERLDFFVFSTYAPKTPHDHYGIVHLGFMGTFFQISEGQYDYQWLLEFFH